MLKMDRENNAQLQREKKTNPGIKKFKVKAGQRPSWIKFLWLIKRHLTCQLKPHSSIIIKLQFQSLKLNFSKMSFWLLKRSQRHEHQRWNGSRASECQSVKPLLGEQTSLSQYYSQLILTWWLCINQLSDVSTLCSAASSLCPSSLLLLLCLSAISFQMSTSLIRLTWENCCLADAPQRPDRSCSLFSPFLSLPSHLWFQYAWSATLHLHHPTTPPLTKPPGELGSALLCQWGDMTHTVMQHKRDKFEMFKGNCIVAVSKRSLQI